ncbi:aminotransferase class V-fold PLP-dependent enzyme [Afifella pfennigii]|uniref:aminotransferase class V-fold PLP-dependent enzyme n=1 Tax=Afifella pfennigii TaxID=209897 RepID=UPI00047EC952|nr:aminotransferase class V-fold PLP-dependent enzyme [Afifella pfennigii]
MSAKVHKRSVYLDANATTRVDPLVLEAMLPFYGGDFGNPSSPHALGAPAKAAIARARAALGALIGAEEGEIVFTSGGTEANNTAILSALATADGRDEIVTSAVEHPAVLALAAHLARERGVTVRVIPVDGKGRLDIEAYKAALGPKTAIASIMWANNETGAIFPIEELADLAHEAGALFHSDAVQAVGRLPLRVSAAGVDFLSLSAHKLHGPKGVGALYVRKGAPFSPLMRGGRQERGRRAGTENVPGIVGLGAAASLAAWHLFADGERVRGLRDRLEAGILARFPEAQVLGDTGNRLANTSLIAFADIDAEALISLLAKAGIAASGGAACASGMAEPSHVLKAMRLPARLLFGAVRFSFSRDSDEADVERALEVLPEVMEKLSAPPPLRQTVPAARPAEPLTEEA